MKKCTTFLLLILFSAFTIISIEGCSLLHPSSKQKTEKKQAKAKKLADKEYEAARKQHMKNQNKQTVEMMKKTRKRSTEVNSYKKRKFLSSKKCR